MSEHISVNGCLSQGYLHFRMQLSLWDARVVSVKMFTNHSGSPASFPLLPSGRHFLSTWHSRLCPTLNRHGQDRQALCPLGAYFWMKRETKPKYTNIRPNTKSLGEFTLGRMVRKDPSTPEAVLFKPLSISAASLLSRNEYVNHYITGERMLWSILIIITTYTY